MQLLDVVSDLGATGVVIEWEDMFPFSGRLEVIRNGNAYSVQDIVDILDQYVMPLSPSNPAFLVLHQRDWQLFP